MNIFILDKNPKLAAEYHCDKHVVKMIVETSQLLCSVFYFNSNIIPPYKLTHKNHPCAKWIRESKNNFIWCCALLKYLLKEYTKRYNKKHKCEFILHWVLKNKNKLHWNSNNLTKFALAMPEQYVSENAINSYRKYYINEKYKIAKWKTKQPYWWHGDNL